LNALKTPLLFRKNPGAFAHQVYTSVKLLSLIIKNLISHLNSKTYTMGKAKYGVYGPITGKLSNLVWFSRYGQGYVRTKGLRTAPLSAAQKTNCRDMALLMDFFKNMKPFLKAGFGHLAAGSTLNYHNLATACNKTQAIEQVDGQSRIVFEAVVLSDGTALKPQDPTVLLSNNGLEFTWAYDEVTDWRSRTDQVLLMAYFPESNEAVYTTSGAKRSEMREFLVLPSSLKAKTMEVYIAFQNDERTDASRSLYLGKLN
jgi:hypothetical protein